MLLWLCLSVCWTTVFSQGQGHLQLREGDVCKLVGGASWTCKLIKDCPKAAEAINNDGPRPQICGWTQSLDTIVCCEPADEKGSKCRDMCKKYAESVFIRLPDELSDGGIRTYDTCGIGKPDIPRAKRLAGAKKSKSREFPHMALVGHGLKPDVNWRCCGSLISERFVLTSAVCANASISKPVKWVRLGDHNIRSEEDENESMSQPTEYEVVEVIIHPEFKFPIAYHNIALLKLDKDVFFTEFIRPICLQTTHQLPNTLAMATGWGKNELGRRSDTLNSVNLTIITHEKCHNAYKNTKSDAIKEGILDESMVCAADPERGRNTCQGDSGGPLQMLLQDPYCMYSQVGITSLGSRCGGDKPSVYTRVSHYVPWIEGIVWP